MATCLTLGLGAANVLGESTQNLDKGYSQSVIPINEKKDDGSQEMSKEYANRFADSLKGRICAVFNYKAGSVLSVIDQDNNITLYSENSPFITLGYSNGNYSVTSINLSGANVAAITGSKNGEVTTENLMSFLEKCGVTKQMLSYTLPTEERSGATQDINSQAVVKWLQKACDELNKNDELNKASDELNSGINHSIQISITAGKGATLTTIEDGQAQKTFSYDGEEISTNVYSNGFLVEQKSVVYVSSITATSDEELTAVKSNNGGTKKINGVTYYKTTQTTKYNDYGKPSEVIRTINGKKDVLMTYTYSANGSLLSSLNKQNNQTTYYRFNGKASYVLNKEGSMVQSYDYLPNGSLDGIKTWNNGKVVSIEAYQFGKSIGTADLSSQENIAHKVTNYNELRKEVNSLKNMSATEIQNYFGVSNPTNISSVALYTEDLKNTALLNAFGFGQDEIKMMATFSNGYSQVGNINLMEEYQNANSTREVSGNYTNVYFNKGAKGKNIKHKLMLQKALEEGATVEVEINGTVRKYKKGDKVSVDGKEVSIEDFIKYAGTNNGYGPCKGENDDLISKITVNKDSNGGWTEDKQKEYMNSLGVEDDKFYNHDMNTLIGAQKVFTATLTVFDKGAQAITIQGKPLVVENNGIRVDPSIIGKYKGMKIIDGKVYAMLEADEINVMDGTGYQKAEGETVYIELDEETAKKLKNVKEGEQIMLNYDVTKDVDGCIAGRINKNYANNGIAIGEKEVESVKADILNGIYDEAYVNKVTAENQTAFAKRLNNYKKGDRVNYKDALDILKEELPKLF